MEVIESVYENDKILLDHVIGYQLNKTQINKKTIYIYPYGLCVHYWDYNPDEDFILSIFSYGTNASFTNMFTIISDPALLTYSGIDFKSHQGTQIFRIKRGYHTFYEVKVVVEDFDTPAERDFCSASSYADCVDQQTNEFFSQVKPKPF